ncbi:hypothetical protein ABFS82_14G183700 [Erythranthe guttata]|uniref:Glabrous enhancer-binding protein-like DBD domain-containing protein n=1 Tax=Erythranthe guttata TaxID=4155 RepID=A0A022RAM4_ERYGU|nr:PREDICTED: uncharacterized protein LOC105958472 [Erythranthe guttata]EYU37064.1 hypothetical protein MIMGU_mgv1a007563mg [Erythranthe guttata]|eukprot:XP_012837927.1 PREDICTED: uncharacterized protein LOC105958472 [Erythranthe guttata]
MASADDPTTTAAAAANIFNEDEDLIDDDDDEEEISDRDEGDSASSAALALDRHLPFTSSAQVTVAFPDPHPHLRLQQPEHHHHQEIVVAKKPMPPDESRKLFQRLWTDEDEIELLQGFLDYTTQRLGAHNSSSQHHHDTAAFYDQIKSKFQLDFNKNQLVEKLRRLKKKYRNVVAKFASGKEYSFKTAHEQATFEISSKIWGSTAFNGYAALPAAPAPASAPIEEEDDDLNSPNFAYFQSPKPNGIDINSKIPRPKKRNRAGVVKVELANPISTINNTPPAVPVAPMASPAVGMGVTPGVSGSMPSVIEETVKSCLSPIIKELLSNSMSSTPNSNSPCCGHGFGLPQNLLPVCFNATMGGDKIANNNRWRKQQMLELEVFSKRLELVQDQIREQLHELRSMGD